MLRRYRVCVGYERAADSTRKHRTLLRARLEVDGLLFEHGAERVAVVRKRWGRWRLVEEWG